MNYVYCGLCHWVHYEVSRTYAEEQVEKFNKFFAQLTPHEKKHYGDKPADIDLYEYCFQCGAGYHLMLEASENDLPRGSTVQPIIRRIE